MVDKILALVAAFGLGGVVTFFVTVKSLGAAIRYSPRIRQRWRELVDQAEREDS